MAIGSAPEAEGPHALTTQLRPCVHYLLVALVTAVLIGHNPFGWSEETSNLSHDVTQRFIIGPLLYPSGAKAPVTVVLYDDTDLAAQQKTWPLKLDDHAEILDSILAAGPRAVFVDFLFIDRRAGDSAEDLVATIENYAFGGVPLLFARAEGEDGVPPIRADIAQGKPQLASVVLPDEHGVARTYAPCSRPGDNPRDCLCVDAGGKTASCTKVGERKRRALTAAFAMYAARLRDDKALSLENPRIRDFDPRMADRMELAADGAWDARFDMEVMWTNRLNRWNEDHLFLGKMPEARKEGTAAGTAAPGKTGADAEGPCPRIGDSALLWLRGAFADASHLRQKCPHTDTLLARFLPLAASDQEHRPEVESRLKDRYVFYGSALTALGDIVYPPTHARMPAIYLHAMAFENLLYYGLSYKRRDLALGDGGLHVHPDVCDTAFAIVVACFALWYLRTHRRSAAARRAAAGRSAAAARRGDADARRRRTYWLSLGLSAGLFFGAFVMTGTAPETKLPSWGLSTGAAALYLAGLTVSAGWSLKGRVIPLSLYVLPVFALAVVAAAFVALPAMAAEAGWKLRLAPSDIALAVLIPTAALCLTELFARARPEAHAAPDGRRDRPPETESWRSLRAFLALNGSWWLFIANMTAFLLLVVLAMFAWFDISIRNWIGIVLLTIVLGEPIQKFWIERSVGFLDDTLEGWPALRSRLRLRERAFMTHEELLGTTDSGRSIEGGTG